MAAGDDFERELAEVPRRSGPPRWIILGGCGCLIPGFLFVAAMAWWVQLVSERIHKDQAWESLSRIVAFDESARGTPTGVEDDPKTPIDEAWEPGEFELLFGGDIPFTGVEEYVFGRDVPLVGQDAEYGEDPLYVSIVKLPAEQAEAATEAPTGTPLHEDMSIDIGGRTLRGRRIPEMVSDEPTFRFVGLNRLFDSTEEVEVRGAGAAVWIREGFADPDEPESDERFDLLVFFQRPDSSEPIRDEEIRAFLAPFDLSGAPPVPGPDAAPAEDGR